LDDGATDSGATYVYAMGRIEPRFPSIAVEKQFAQASGQADTAGLTDRQTLRSVLAAPENRYLVRMLCWVLVIEGLEAYVLVPRDPTDRALLLDSLRETPRPGDVDLVIGVRGPLAPPEMCNGLTVPMVAFDQIFSFDVEALVGELTPPAKISARDFAASSEELFAVLKQLAENHGATNEHRALNYLAVRYPALYALTAEAFAKDSSLTSVDVRQSLLAGPRDIVDVVFRYTNRQTDVTESYFVRVDVTELFPFLVSGLARYFDR
jgi:hypothetical protein